MSRTLAGATTTSGSDTEQMGMWVDPGCGGFAHVKLLELGVARLQLRPHAITRTGAIVGTIGYMAPEQASGSARIDARADVSSLGCVLFECLTALPVFTGEHVVAVLARVVREDAPRLLEVRPGLPPELDDLLARMLAKDPDARPANGGAVLRAPCHRPGPGATHPAARRRRRRRAARHQRHPREPRCDVAVGRDRAGHRDAATGLADVEALAKLFGGDLTRLADDTLLLTLAGRGTATDQAARPHVPWQRQPPPGRGRQLFR